MNVDKILDETKKINEEYFYFNTISEDLARESAGKEGKLKDIAISVKDCIVVKDVESRAGSRILSGYKPVFDATVIEKIKKEGGIILGKTAQDVFGFGSFSVNVGLGMKIPLNPFDKERATGGSSGGAAGFTQKASFRHIAISESTGGSIVCPASFCGVNGLCPTYGLVSRYGLMDYANSMDKIGAMAKNVNDLALGLNVIAGHDHKDSTSINRQKEDYMSFLNKDLSDVKIGIMKEGFQEGVDKEIMEIVLKATEELGIDTKEISLPLNYKYGVQAYYLMAICEASTNLAKFCGMRYGKHERLEGNFNEYFSKVRSLNFNAEAKRRIIIGTFARMSGFRDAYYIKGTRVRTKLIEEYKKAFKKVDVFITPTMPVIAPRFDEIEKLTPWENYMMDIYTNSPNLAGLPHISIPVGFKNKLPVGLLAVADHFNEGKLIQVAKAMEK